MNMREDDCVSAVALVMESAAEVGANAPELEVGADDDEAPDPE